MIYLALWLLDVYGDFTGMVSFGVFASGVGLLTTVIVYGITFEDAQDYERTGKKGDGWEETAHHVHGITKLGLSILKWAIPLLIITAVILPSEKTMRIIVGVYAAEQVSSVVAKRPEFDKLVKATDKFLDEYLEEKSDVGTDSKRPGN